MTSAQPLHERALAITEKALGPKHPDTANIVNNLACLLYAQGDLAGARPLFERALAIRQKVLGASHPLTINSARATADAFDAEGRTGESAALRARYNLPSNGS